MNSESFTDWLYMKPDWNEIKFQYNTGKKYQHRQDLEALFWNTYLFIEQRVEAYYKKHKVFPDEEINELLFEFRQSFPKHDRVKAINYFDDLLELLIEKYSSENNRVKKKKQISGYSCDLSETELKLLYDNLTNGYIDKNTDFRMFKSVFKDNPLPTDFTPIKRTKKFTKTLLIYFASELFQKENQSDYVSITEYCFNAKDLSQSKKNYIEYNKNQKPKGYNQIDEIIQTIYTHL